MTPADFRRIALSLEGVEEVSHAGLPAFRVGGRRFASLASQADGYGNLTLTLEHQAAFVEEAPRDFPAHSGRVWKDGTYAYSLGCGERGHTNRRTTDRVETADREERKEKAGKARLDRAGRSSK
jgi:hypothetical protein